MSNSLFGTGYKPQEGSSSRKLPAGGYIVRIMNAKMENAKTSGLPMVVIQFDICEGEYMNYFREKYDTDKSYRDNAKWQGIARIPAVDAEGKQRSGFNSFCGAVEKSNDIKLPTEDVPFLNALKGQVLGIIFGREEVKLQNGDLVWTTKPKYYRSTETIDSGNYQIPQDEPYRSSAGTAFASAFSPADGLDSFSAAEDDIPF